MYVKFLNTKAIYPVEEDKEEDEEEGVEDKFLNGDATPALISPSPTSNCEDSS